jgi:outer membrane protein OmpA-like peptidoglycan-associated protein
VGIAIDSRRDGAWQGRLLRALLCAALLVYSSSGAIDSSVVPVGADQPPQITFARENGRLTIRGVISSEGSRQILTRVVTDHYAEDVPGFDVYTVSPLPPLWSLMAETTLVSLAGVQWFDATLRDDHIVIRGIADDPLQVDKVRSAIERVSSPTVAVDLDFLTIPSGQGLRELCEQRFAAVTRFHTVNFSTSAEEPAASATGLLDGLAEVALDCPAASFTVIGHTDSRGDEPGNIALSRQRAEAAISYLEQRGIDRSRLRSSGAGSSQPVASNASALGRNSNRRLEFRMNFEKDESDSPHEADSLAGNGLH